jgi:hypothetical protein
MATTDQSQQTDDNFERQWFNYVIDATVLANAVQSPTQFQIQTDADFELWWITGSATAAASLKFLMKEAATSRDFIGTTASTVSGAGAFNGINFNLLCGLASAAAMFPIAVPYVMPATRTYTILLTDSSGAQQTVEISFSGFKLWQRSTATPAAGNSQSH